MGAASQLQDLMKFEIEVTQGPHTGLRLSFTKGTASIGRGPENDIVLANDPRASRQHAEIKQRGNEFVVVNLSQKNFILVNGANLQSEVLHTDSLIQIGDTEIRFIPTMPPPKLTPVGAGGVNVIPSAPAATQRVQMPQAPMGFSPPGMPQQQQPQYYQAPAVGPRAASSGRAAPNSAGLLQNPKVRFYGIIAIVGLLAWFLLSPSKNKVLKDPNAFRTSTESLQDVADAEKRTAQMLTVKKEKYDSVQYKRAQENFIRGFRDYQQGQYARAREAFQVVLNLDPENELANRYYRLAKVKFDELVKFNMIQGNRYREKRNWRMCQSNYSNVLTMLLNRKEDPTFKEAKQFYEECTLNLEGGRI